MSKRLIDPKKPFQAVYSIYQHEFLGCLMSAHVVEELPNGRLSLYHQSLLPKNFNRFAHHLDAQDKRLAEILFDLSQPEIIRRFSTKAKSPADFFIKYFTPDIKKLALDFVNRKMSEAMPLLKGKNIGVMGSDGYPNYQEVEMLEEQASVLFHFKRQETETRYYPTIKLAGEKVDFQYKDAKMVTREPAWMLLNNQLFSFKGGVDGRKLKPFLKKWYIAIPRATEETYFSKFVTGLVERYNVYARGFDIKTVRPEADFSLLVEHGGNAVSAKLQVNYGDYTFPVAQGHKVKAVMEKDGDEYQFIRVVREMGREKEVEKFMRELKPGNDLMGFSFLSGNEGLDWLAANVPHIQEQGIRIIQKGEGGKLNFDQPEVVMETTEDGDWFDIRAMVKVGDFMIPFLNFRNHILKGKRDFKLPDGSIAILPEAWFSEFRHLLEVTGKQEGERLRIKRYQVGLLGGGGPAAGISGRIKEMYEAAEAAPSAKTPKNLKATLRSYQQKGFDWLSFLQEHHFGGILADDMGLGKTLQALTLLQRERENDPENTSLIVMPTSLIYNWKAEAKKFAPDLKVYVHTGVNRKKDPAVFAKYDLILTTYGLARQDLKLFKQFPFHYVILDESQMIKNPTSKTSKAVRELVCRHRLSLSGTPLENSLTDLWSQMTFLNPGLLGSEAFFKKFYVQPIEKAGDEKRKEQLRNLLHPFMLRRTKEQVADELPPKIEHLHFCEMEPDQQELYDTTKNAWRNVLLNFETPKEFNKNKFNILAGLQKLRQIAIHPQLAGEELPEGQEEWTSGKYLEFKRLLQNVLEKGAKVLVFSQFVKLLQLIRKDLDQDKIPYCYLDGGTRDRQKQVEKFQNDPDIPVFLISLKAGGVGLNLTAAEYVFILDPWWNPAVENQAIDRSHRIGQKKTVFYYKFITRDSIEEKILKLQEKKTKLSKEIVTVEDEVFKKLDKDSISSLLE